MVKYRLIIEYHQKGNNNTQVATLCSCSRMTVWKVINRLNEADISAEELLELSDEKINSILFPERKKQSDGYLIPDYKWEDYQMRKRGASIRLCWRRYCKRATYHNLKAYSWASYISFYEQYRKPCSHEKDPKDIIRNKRNEYNLHMSWCNPNGNAYRKIKEEKEAWLESLHLDESKIL